MSSTDSRLQDAINSGKSFQEQVMAAQLSGQPFCLVSDLRFGKHVIYKDQVELADDARVALEAASQTKDSLVDLIINDPVALSKLKLALLENK